MPGGDHKTFSNAMAAVAVIQTPWHEKPRLSGPPLAGFGGVNRRYPKVAKSTVCDNYG